MAQLNDFEYGIFYKDILASFYKDISEDSFKDVTLDEIEELKERASILTEKHFNNKNLGETKVYRYCKIMERLHSNCRRRNSNNMPFEFDTHTDGEKYLLFMLIVDPKCEALEIYLTENNKKTIKKKITDLIGIYDPWLIRIENYYIKNLMSKVEKHKYKTKINDKIYK